MAMGDIDIRLLGSEKLQEQLLRLDPRIQKKLVMPALKKGAEHFKVNAEMRIPVNRDRKDNVHLRHVGLRVGTRRARRGVLGYAVFTPTRPELSIPGTSPWFYPTHLELGHDNVAARPFLRATAKMVEGTVLAIVKNHITQGLNALAAAGIG